jgi:hypothetical protein
MKYEKPYALDIAIAKVPCMDNLHYDIWEITRFTTTTTINIDLYNTLSGGVRNSSNFSFEDAMELLINRKLYLSDAYAT